MRGKQLMINIKPFCKNSSSIFIFLYFSFILEFSIYRRHRSRPTRTRHSPRQTIPGEDESTRMRSTSRTRSATEHQQEEPYWNTHAERGKTKNKHDAVRGLSSPSTSSFSLFCFLLFFIIINVVVI